MNRTRAYSLVAGVLGLSIALAALVTMSGALDHRTGALRAVLETSVAIVGTLVALLTYGRYRRSGDARDLWIVCAVLLLSWVHSLFGSIPDLISPHSVGNGWSERTEMWGQVVTRTIAAGLLFAAAFERPHSQARVRRTRLGRSDLLATIAIGTVTLALLVWLAPIGGRGLLDQPSWPLVLAPMLQVFGAGLLLVAILGMVQRSAAENDAFLGWIAAGCSFAAISMVSYALWPATDRTGGFGAGDVLRAAAVATWAIGAVFEIVSYWSAISDSARRDERARVALALHDGLAQELALLSSYTHAPSEAWAQAEWQNQLRATAERALAEARRAIGVLSSDEPLALEADLERTAEWISGAAVDVRVEVGDGGRGASIDALQRESIVRIVREAVTNAVRHGGASHIDISFDSAASRALRVCDDGIGFDPANTAVVRRYGLVSMREQAEAIGASLAVRSAPGAGTTVEVTWP